MTEFGTVRIAAVQATPVILDAEATIDKAIRLVDRPWAPTLALIAPPLEVVDPSTPG